MEQLYEPASKRLTKITGKTCRAINNGIIAGTIPGTKIAGSWLVSTRYVDQLIELA